MMRQWHVVAWAMAGAIDSRGDGRGDGLEGGIDGCIWKAALRYVEVEGSRRESDAYIYKYI